MKRTPQFFFARQMRHEMTFEEKLFWNAIRRQDRIYGRWRRQVPILKYIVDFCCHEYKLIVEIDGRQHDIDVDASRDEALTQVGYQVLRYSNHQVKNNLEDVITDIISQIPPPKTAVRF